MGGSRYAWAVSVLLAVIAAKYPIHEAFGAETGKKFGTFFTPTGDVVELFHTGDTSLEGKLVKLGQPPETGSIVVRGENAQEGKIKLNFYQGNDILQSVTYNRTTRRKTTLLGTQIYTDWRSNNLDTTDYKLSEFGLQSLNSIIIGTAKPAEINAVDWPTSSYSDFDTYFRAQQRLDAFAEKYIGASSKAPISFGIDRNKYAAIRASRSVATYIAAAGIKQNVEPSDVHVQTLGVDDAIVYMKSADVKNMAALLPMNVSFTDNIEVLTSPLTPQAIGIKIPHPNLIETYVRKYDLEDGDLNTLSRIYNTMGVRFCDKDPPNQGVMLIYCDYFRDMFARDGDPEWYRTAISIAVTTSSEETFTVVSMFPRTYVANNTKADYDNAKRKWAWPKRSVEDAESFLIHAFIKALTREYPKTHR